MTTLDDLRMDGKRAKQMLVALLVDPDRILLDKADKDLLLVTCCMSMVMASICMRAGYDTEAAHADFNALAAECRKHIAGACEIGRSLPR